jgi:hypothetical protein
MNIDQFDSKRLYERFREKDFQERLVTYLERICAEKLVECETEDDFWKWFNASFR